ncbi:tRNA nucleotidyltransferase/poly(A) polymerase [Desulfocapsa sulfexigens DSM 10523]|uniref:tRNA nucleotidyltransferase/poly(A) polymerase n=1 Tax=Desulfocapsa sulfexigens (strain DSM 10523 / SB164P1) TaxID=1167006 RepID=M1P7P5_DESSD|nr:tRNA nucleotidyltransferase/poly(A) polymerase [Desulfocapsa sulfexigens]AGF77722.1 tRNA nucleotidyltransferase/poly(A) polymerase [Desulfocapsa sulfexigens DSM 10523]
MEFTLPMTFSSEPRIITTDNHPIRHHMIDRDAMKVLHVLRDNGYAGYLVGGGVRDLYLGMTPKDFDISTDARPGQIRKLFRNSRTIGRRFRLVQVFFGGKEIEVSTLRSLSEYDLDGPDAVLAPNNTYGSLGEDAQRRDLTVNGLFYEIEGNTIIDYVGGIEDLDKSVVRFVGEPERRITRDPVRMLRAIRHAGRLGFSIAPESWEAICSHHEKLPLCPPSRIRDEFFKDLHSGSFTVWLKLALDSELFFDILALYKQALSKKEKVDERPYREQLIALAKVIDRSSTLAKESEKRGLNSDFLLALVLVPWANSKFDLVHQQLKGAAAFRFSKILREALDRELGVQLNLRRSIRQQMVTLLSNLPQFLRYREDNSWPRWIKKKSYYKSCALFCELYSESLTGDKAELNLSSLPQESSRSEKPKTPSSNQGRRRKSYNPAFSSSKKGVFGFKK